MHSKASRSFASDNNAGVHPEVFRALKRANKDHVLAYGDDFYTERAVAKFKSIFGKNIEVFFVFNGTGANVLSLKALTKSHYAIVCSDCAHIANDECGAPELFTGCKLMTIEAANGKLTVEKIAATLHGLGDQHHVQPKVISITQATEWITVYTPPEIKAITKFAHAHGMYVHMDGARIANAAASLNCSLAAITGDVGVDVLSFGGTKNGIMGGEAVVFFDRTLAADFKFMRKQGMQLASKMRFIAVQFEALLSNNLWLRNARHANALAKHLAQKISQIPNMRIVQPVEANGVFVEMPKSMAYKIQKKSYFYIMGQDSRNAVVRLMCSFDTTKRDIEDFSHLGH